MRQRITLLFILFCSLISYAQNKLPLEKYVAYNTFIYTELYNMYKINQHEISKDSIITNEQITQDSALLIMSYYPWKRVFDTKSVYRVGFYNDGIGILKGLIKYTKDYDLINKYTNELMLLYDTWYEYADTINAGIDVEFSKTLIKSEKAKSYIEIYSEEVTDTNVMTSEYINMYNYIKDALNEPNNQEEVYYLNIDKFMRISTQRLKYDWKKYQEQYALDFEVFDSRMQLLLQHVTNPVAINNINYLYKGHNDNFNRNSDELTITTGNCEDMEEAFSNQMLERALDEKFLNKVIRNMKGCPDSNVYLEALENYIYLPNISAEDNLAKRKLLVSTYLKKERYNESIEQIKFLLGLTEGIDNIEKSNLYYLWGSILERQNNYQTATFRYKNAIKLNPNFGNAYYRLAIMYSKNKLYPKDPLRDSYRYLLCIDKLEEAKNLIANNNNKYNNVPIKDINSFIESFKSMCPTQTDAFMLGVEYSTPGNKYIFPGGVMKGESTIIRFY